METELYNAIRQAVSEGLTSAMWLMIVSSLLFSGLGLFFGAYLKKRGETFATNQNFRRVLEQLERTTKLTEQIQSDSASLKSYNETRGQQLATRDNFEDLLDQLKAQTRATEDIKGEIATQTTKATEEIKAEIAKSQKEQEVEQAYRMLQQPVLEEATRIIVRLRELFKDEFGSHYRLPWSPDKLPKQNLEANKRDTAVYRVFRFLGAMHIYHSRAAGLPPHPINGFFDFYFSKKIVPILASDRLPGTAVMWRDSILEVSEIFVEYSEKWKMFKTVGWFDFVGLLTHKDETGFVNYYAERVASFIKEPNLRLAIFAIYLIDLQQDILGHRSWEGFRHDLLRYIQSDTTKNFSLYGRTIEGMNDIAVMDIDGGNVPRNYRSPHYDQGENHMNYRIHKAQDE